MRDSDNYMCNIQRSITDQQGMALVKLEFSRIRWIFREQYIDDNGIDAHIEMILADRPNGRLIALQIKSGASYFSDKNDNGYVYRGDQKHLDYWLEHSLPVLIILADVNNNIVYYERITSTNTTSTGKGWKVTIPFSNILNESSIENLRDIAINIKIQRRYSIYNQEDLSHPCAKRYLARIILNSDYPRYYIQSLAEEITSTFRLETFQKSQSLETLFRGCPADIVWLFFYRTLDDVVTGVPLCSTIWVSPELDTDYKPHWHGDYTQGSVNVYYFDYRNLLESNVIEHQLNKSDSISIMRKYAMDTFADMSKCRVLIESLINNRTISKEEMRLLENTSKEVRNRCLLFSDVGFSSTELEGLMHKLECVLVMADNLFMLIFPKELDNIDTFSLRTYLGFFDKDWDVFSNEAKQLGIL